MDYGWPNLGYLAKQFLDKECHVFVLVDEFDKSNLDLDILASALQILGQEVILLRGLKKIEAYANIQQAIDTSVKSAKIIDGVIMMTPIRYQSKADDGWHDNKEALLLFLAGTVEQKGAMIFLLKIVVWR